MEFGIIILIIIFTFFIQSFFRDAIRYRHLKKLPGKKPHFLKINFGWLLKLLPIKGKIHNPDPHIIERILNTNLLYQKQGVHCFWVGSKPFVSIFSPELLEIVLTSNVSLEKSFEYIFFGRWLENGLLVSSGPKWRDRRKLLTKSFHSGILEQFLTIFNEKSLFLVNKLQQIHKNEHVDFLPLITLCTLDIVCETLMGSRVGAQKGDNIEYVTAFHNLAYVFSQRIIRPWLWSDVLFNLSSLGKKFGNSVNILNGLSEKVIREKKKERLTQKMSSLNEEKKTAARKTFMDLLLDLHLDGKQLSEKDIQNEVNTFMLEGHDTTAMGLTHALYSIGLHPKIQEKVHEELDTVFGNDYKRHVTLDDVRKMKYLECVLKESLRLYPPLPVIGRKLNEDIEYNGMFIPKGTDLHCNIISVHRRADFYPNPEIFDPDRFKLENSLDRHPFAYIPFSAGPRNCIGQKFGLLEEKVVVSNILRHFRVVSLDPIEQFKLLIEFTLRPAKPVRLKFIPRR